MKKIFTLICIFSALSAAALNPADFTVTRVTSPYFVVDGNSPATGPVTAYVGFKITNSSASVTYTNLKFTITSITTSVTGQNYTLVSPANGISIVGTLAPGASKVCYFYVSYPANVTPTGTFNYSLADAAAGTKTGNFPIYNRSSISANAGGLATQSINNQDLIGGIVYDDVTYTLGNIKSGDESDFQISVSTQFDPTKLTLLKTEVLSSTVAGVNAGTVNQLYFTNTANQSSGTVTIRWSFKISSYNFTALILPYAGATSGATNYKYAISTDLGGGTPIVISSTANPLLITKASDKLTYGTSNTAIFTVTIQNPGAFGITIDKITDDIPTGFVYQGLHASSDVTASNSTTMPAVGSTGTITFEGGVTSGANTSYSIPSGGSIVLKYTATSPASQALNLLTTARGFIGVTQFGFALNTVNVTAALPITLTSLKGSWVDEKVKLDWVTESEENASYFEVQRSTDNTIFNSIGRVAANGNSSSRINYSFLDQSPSAVSYYRLKMVDIDGKFKYSAVVAMQKQLSQELKVYPNPFIDNISLSLFSVTGETARISLVNKAGEKVWQQEHVFNRGMNTLSLNNLGNLSKGVYVLRIVTGDKTISRKVVKL